MSDLFGTRAVDKDRYEMMKQKMVSDINKQLKQEKRPYKVVREHE